MPERFLVIMIKRIFRCIGALTAAALMLGAMPASAADMPAWLKDLNGITVTQPTEEEVKQQEQDAAELEQLLDFGDQHVIVMPRGANTVPMVKD